MSSKKNKAFGDKTDSGCNTQPAPCVACGSFSELSFPICKNGQHTRLRGCPNQKNRCEAPSSVTGSLAREETPLQSKVITTISKDWVGNPQVKTTLFQKVPSPSGAHSSECQNHS